MTEHTTTEENDSLSTTEAINAINHRLDTLTARVAAMEALPAMAAAEKQKPDTPPPLLMDEEGFWSWIGTSTVLPRIAAICFLMVVALMLRVLTDSGVINLQFGSFIGIAYALGLIILGGKMLGKKNRLAPVFPVCGAFLLFSVVLETQSHFASISATTSYLMLGMSLILLAAIGVKNNFPGLTSIGLIGGSLAATAINFPNPCFPALLLFLITANITAAVAAEKQPDSGWSRWLLYFVTAMIWILWTSKLKVPLLRHETVPEALSLLWFLPTAFLYSITFMIAPALAIERNKWPSIFDLFVPTANVFLIFGAAWGVIATWNEQKIYLLGLVGFTFAVIHMGIAYRMYRREIHNGGICAFTCAGGILLAMILPALTGSLLIALPVWSVIAFILALLSSVCEIGGIRLLSYLMQASACLLGGLSGMFIVNGPNSGTAMVVTAIIAVISGLQFRWSQKNPVICSAGIFPTLDPNNRSGTILLITSLLSTYYSLQIGTALLLTTVGIEASADALSSSRSLLINIGAIILMLDGLRKKNSDLIIAAVVVTFLGAIKVFGHDLFNDHGVARVLSIFSFGLVAAVGSVVMSKWQQFRSQKTEIA
ncbi:MAG: hypothetical protein OEL55_03780 [Desulfobulbaceae bacterium]|nr:hypothetical protein [Desulfobulbaceae bacterium]